MRRRQLLAGLGASTAALAVDSLTKSGLAEEKSVALNPLLPSGTREEAVLATLPGKKPLIKLAYRPPNYETPVEAFGAPLTPNDKFFVRYHLGDIPDLDALRKWSLKIGGDAAEHPVELTLKDLMSLPQVEITAICQCSGNRRGLFEPHVPGVQWGSGAMGNAKWRGVRLRDILAKAGIKANALEVAMRGADGPVLEATPVFWKSLPMAKALDDNTIIAVSMNGEPLPHLNGFPARLVVAGWTGTYWVKHITMLELRSTLLDNFWMKTAYRVPRGLFPSDIAFPSQDQEKSTPITEIVVNSLITGPARVTRVPASGFEVRGIAWDGGHGVKTVEVSTDGGKSWAAANLGDDLGRFAFRVWQLKVSNAAPGALTVLVKATANNGATQPEKLILNPAGYHNNIIQRLELAVA